MQLTDRAVLITGGKRIGAAVARARAETPGCEDVTHLNNAGAGLMPSAICTCVRLISTLPGKYGLAKMPSARPRNGAVITSTSLR